MKIGILTHPLKNNYGGLLQAYALQTVLKRMGHDAIVLDRHQGKPSVGWRIARFVKNIALICFAGKKDRVLFPFSPSDAQAEIISRNTSAFVREYISSTEVLNSTVDLRRVAEEEMYDVYIVGSDQVWRPFTPNIENYFLDFVEEQEGIKRISYAASFGVDQWGADPKRTRCSQLAKLFDAVSVREDSGIELCKKHLDVEAVQVVDPTMLLDPEDYEALVIEQSEPVSTGNLMTYVLDSSLEKTEIIRKVESAMGLEAFSVMRETVLTRQTQHEIKKCIYPPVTQWLRGYMDARFLIADSFHGCVFAIVFNIPFIAIGNRRRGLTRFESLLRQFNLMNRLVLSSEDVTEELIMSSIDWNEVNIKRATLKATAENFLINALE